MTHGLRDAGFAVLDSASTYFLCVDLAASGMASRSCIINLGKVSHYAQLDVGIQDRASFHPKKQCVTGAKVANGKASLAGAVHPSWPGCPGGPRAAVNEQAIDRDQQQQRRQEVAVALVELEPDPEQQDIGDRRQH